MDAGSIPIKASSAVALGEENLSSAIRCVRTKKIPGVLVEVHYEVNV